MSMSQLTGLGHDHIHNQKHRRQCRYFLKKKKCRTNQSRTGGQREAKTLPHSNHGDQELQLVQVS